MKTTRCFGMLLLILGLAGPAAARTEVDETRPAERGARILVDNLAGSVRVTGWDREEMRVRGTLGDDVEGLDITGDAGYLAVEVDIPRTRGRGNWDLEADLELWVPASARLEVETVSASIEVAEVTGRLELESVSGEVDVRGDVGQADLSTVSGRIRFAGSTPSLAAESVSGAVRVEGANGQLELSTVSGRLEVMAGSLERGTLESVSGSVELSCTLAQGARLDIDSHSGNVTLDLPRDASASFEIQTFSGRIDNESGPEPQRTDRYGPGERLEFSRGGGDARVTVETFSGNVRLRAR